MILEAKSNLKLSNHLFVFLLLVSESSVSEPLQRSRDFCTGSDNISEGGDTPGTGQGSGGLGKMFN